MVFEVAECLGSIGVEAPFLTSRSASRSLGSGDSQSGSRPDSANPSLVTALSSTAVSNEPNIEPSNDKAYLNVLKTVKTKVILYLPPSHCVQLICPGGVWNLKHDIFNFE